MPRRALGARAPPSLVLKASPPSRGSGVPSRTHASSAGAKPSALTSCQSARKPSGSSSAARRDLQEAKRLAQEVVALGVGIRGREPEHHLRESGGGGVALEVRGEPRVQSYEIEARQDVELAMLLHQEPRLPLAQELKRSPEPAAGPQRAFGDGALHPVLPGGQPHDL